jgi:hypothetical protein
VDHHQTTKIWDLEGEGRPTHPRAQMTLRRETWFGQRSEDTHGGQQRSVIFREVMERKSTA